MTSIGYATLQIIPSLRGLDRSLSGQLGDTSRAGRQAGESYSGGFKSVLPLLAGAIAAIGFGQLASEAIAASDATDKFKQTLKFAKLPTDAIESLSKTTRKYADQTVYDLGDIQNITAQLAANSVPDFDKLAEAAGNLNAAAGGNKETFKSVGMMLTQTAGAGKLTTENWNQLADAIPGASGLLQDAMRKNGAFTGNFRAAMEKGQITAAEFNQAIMDLGMDDAAKKAATSTKTFEGAWGSLKATMVGGLSDVFDKFKPGITTAMSDISDGISSAMPTILSGLDLIGNGFSSLQGLASSPALNAFGTQASDSLAKITPPLTDLWTAITTQLEPALRDLAKASAPLVGQFGTLASSLSSGLTPIFIAVVGAITSTIIPALVALTDGFTTNVIPAISDVISAFQDAVIVITPIVTQIVDFVLAKFAEWGPTISQYMTQLTEIVGGALSLFAKIVRDNLGWIQGFWATWGGTILAVTGAIFDTTMGVIGGALNAIQGVIKAATSIMKGDWKGAMDGLVQAARGAASILLAPFDAIRNVAGGILASAGRAIMDGFLGGLRSGWGAVTDFVGGIASWIAAHKGPLSYDYTILQPAGRIIMDGLVDAMGGQLGKLESMVGRITDTISGVGGSYSVRAAVSSSASGSSASGSSADDLAAAIQSSLPALADLVLRAASASTHSYARAQAVAGRSI